MCLTKGEDVASKRVYVLAVSFILGRVVVVVSLSTAYVVVIVLCVC